MKYLTYLGLVSVLLCSCEGSTRIENTVTNQSSTPIHLEISSIYTDFKDTVIQPGETAQVVYREAMGGRPEPGYPATNISQMLTYNATDTVGKSFIEKSSWNSVAQRVKRVPSIWDHKHRFVVTDADF